jgi:DNA-binding transcriptional MerR regulator
MPANNQSATFNLKAVMRETGLKADTLRAWERRYDLPQPQRSAGRHRLYSQRDIDTLKWLIARRGEGLSISRAAALWREIESNGQNPLQGQAQPAFSPQGDAIAQLRQDWLAACLAFDERRAEQILTQALALYPPETVCLQVLQKGLSSVGEGWYRGEINVQQEHFVSVLALRRLQALVASAAPPTRPGRILIGCAPEEEHVFGALLLTFLLKRRGWEALYLGARVPTVRLAETLVSVQPQLVILAAQRLHTAATLHQTAQLLRRESVPLGYGGLIFNRAPELRQRIPGHFVGERLETAPQTVEELLLSPRPSPPVEAIPEACQQALAHYRQRQTQLEAAVWQSVASLNLPSAYVALANQELARNIMAALALGDVNLASLDISWVKGLLVNEQQPTETLYHFLTIYYQAAQAHLDEQGEPIVNWLATVNKT